MLNRWLTPDGVRRRRSTGATRSRDGRTSSPESLHGPGAIRRTSQHSGGEPDPKPSAALAAVLDPLLPAMTPAQREEDAAIRARGTSDSRVGTEGTIAYLITLDSGFRIMYRDS